VKVVLTGATRRCERLPNCQQVLAEGHEGLRNIRSNHKKNSVPTNWAIAGHSDEAVGSQRSNLTPENKLFKNICHCYHNKTLQVWLKPVEGNFPQTLTDTIPTQLCRSREFRLSCLFLAEIRQAKIVGLGKRRSPSQTASCSHHTSNSKAIEYIAKLNDLRDNRVEPTPSEYDNR